MHVFGRFGRFLHMFFFSLFAACLHGAENKRGGIQEEELRARRGKQKKREPELRRRRFRDSISLLRVSDSDMKD
ncbi:hypothetical protein HDV64DRAFT_250506 [Trichoderma sp. TUCIM 5745]